MNRIGRDGTILIVGLLAGLYLYERVAQAAPAKTFDERKWERIAKNRELRIATERKYEACMNTCAQTCRGKP